MLKLYYKAMQSTAALQVPSYFNAIHDSTRLTTFDHSSIQVLEQILSMYI